MEVARCWFPGGCHAHSAHSFQHPLFRPEACPDLELTVEERVRELSDVVHGWMVVVGGRGGSWWVRPGCYEYVYTLI